jgi:hypothetical protein
MRPSNADVDRLLESALGPVEPPPRVRSAVLRVRSPWREVLRAAVPFAAGVLTVLAVRALAPEPSRDAPAIPLESIADRLPPPPPPRPEPARAAAPRPPPLPRIS